MRVSKLTFIMQPGCPHIRNTIVENTVQENFWDTVLLGGWLVGWLLWYINLCRLFNAKSIFMQRDLFQTIQFSMSTQFNCQKHFYFKQFSLFKQI